MRNPYNMSKMVDEMLSKTNFRLQIDSGDLLRIESIVNDPVYGMDQIILIGTLEQVFYFLCGWAAHQKYAALLRFNEQRAIKKRQEEISRQKVHEALTAD